MTDKATNTPFYEAEETFENSKIVFKKSNDDYDDFINKFKPKKTTDDCYTPKEVYNVVLKWLKDKGKLKDGQTIIRPFFPGNDYKKVDYPEGSIVVDNPPFSIFAEIVRFYTERKIPFFLFGPHLTLIISNVDVTYIVIGADIIYENGAIIKTSFVSNVFEDLRAFSDLNLFNELEAINISRRKNLPKYNKPDEVMTVSDFHSLLIRGVPFSLNKNECVSISQLDDQKKHKKRLFGMAFLISKAKAKAKAISISSKIPSKVSIYDLKLSEREQNLVKKLSEDNNR